MPEWGITEEGISTPSYSDILDYIATRWEEEFGTEADMSSRSVEGQFFRVIAEQISNKGLGWSEIESLWQVIEDTYNASFIPTANGAALDHLVTYRGLTRREAQAASGILVFSGSPNTTIDAGTQASTAEGTTFETTREATINQYGVAPVPAECTVEGEAGNVIANIITNSQNYEVNNPNDTHILHFGSNRDYWEEVPNDETTTQYQIVEIDQLKYGTSVNQFTLPIRATKEGVYALRLAVLDHGSGNVLYRTETQEKKLTSGEIWEVNFTGEDFDFLQPSIGDAVRIAPVNLSYSADALEVALERNEAAEKWFHGSANQHASLNMSVTTQVRGAFTGGIDQESDAELRSRYLLELSKGGSARPAAIRAELYDIPSIRHAEVFENNTPTDFRPDGLPPYSIEVVVWGGSNEEILQVLQTSRSAGINTWGNHIGVTEDEYGQVHEYRYSRAEEVEVYVDVTIVTGQDFPANGAELIKNTCAEVIGGEDLDGAFHAGSVGVGETLYQSELETALHNNIQGLRSVKTTIGTSEDQKVDGDLAMDTRETPIMRPNHIYISKQ